MARPSDRKKDQELVNILTANARIPLAEVAKLLGVSRATVQGRLTRLEREGVILGYTTVIGKDEVQATTLSAVIMIELEVKQQANVIALLRRRPEIIQCYTVSGHFDLFVKIQCINSTHLDEIIDTIAVMDGVRRTTSSIILARKFER